MQVFLAQGGGAPVLPTRRMPPKRTNHALHFPVANRPPGLQPVEADWERRFDKRRRRVAAVLARPAFQLLVENGLCPMPPAEGLRIGTRRWEWEFIHWRDHGLSMAARLQAD